MINHDKQIAELESLCRELKDANPQGIKLVVTGSRGWKNRRLILKAVSLVTEAVPVAQAIHGDARGADRMFAAACHRFGIKQITAVLPNWDVHSDECPEWHQGMETCKMAGHRRNGDMVNMAPDLCLAFSLDGSRGTQGMISRCRSAAVPVVAFFE